MSNESNTHNQVLYSVPATEDEPLTTTSNNSNTLSSSQQPSTTHHSAINSDSDAEESHDMLMDAFEDFSESDIDDDDWDDRHIDHEVSRKPNHGIRSFFKKPQNNYASLGADPDAGGSSASASETGAGNDTLITESSQQSRPTTVENNNEQIPLENLELGSSASGLNTSSSSQLLSEPSSSFVPETNTTNTNNNENPRRGLFSRGIFSGWRSRLSRPSLTTANQNDGVFNNMNAKPDTESVQESDVPPSYEEAAADATPLYWETTIMAPGYSDEIFIDGLPVGSPINFIWNMMVSAAFQFLGFLITYLLHTSHAAKQGARAGLGFTLFQYGFYLQPSKNASTTSPSNAKEFEPSNPNDYEVGSNHDKLAGSFHQLSNTDTSLPSQTSSSFGNTSASSWISVTLMTIGVLIIAKSIFDYIRARKMEMVISQSPSNLVHIEPEDADEMV